MNPVNSGANEKARGEAREEIVSEATLMDRDGQPLAIVQVTLLPTLRQGGFRLPSSEEAHRTLTTAASLQMSDGKPLRLNHLRVCNAFHLISPEKPHLEFDYE